MKKNKTIKLKADKAFWECFLICTVTALLSFLYFIISGNGILVIRDDFNQQQIPFTMALHNALGGAGGLSGWTWNLDLGTPTIEGFSFYELGSPFFWITMLFPTTWFPYIAGWLYIAKYVVAGMTSFTYFRRFVKNPRFAVIGAILYAFSGFQATNLGFYHFHDVVAFFPLLLIGLEKAMDDRKNKALFIFAVFLNCMVNYFFFIQEVVFLIIYFIIRFWTKDLKELGKRLIACITCGLSGMAMSAIIFIPSIIYIQGNPRSELQLSLANLVWDSKWLLFIIKGILLPGEAMYDHSSIIAEQWNSTACYMPMVGLTFVFAYLMKKKDWLSKILKLLFIMSFLPILSAVFLLFTTIQQRWWYMMVLMMALATVIVIENAAEYNIKKGALINIVLVIGFYCLVRFMKYSESPGDLVYHEVRFLGYSIIALSGVIFIYLLAKYHKITYRSLVTGIAFFAIVTTATTLHYYRRDTTTPSEYHQQIALGSQLEAINEQYRYNSADNILTLTGNAAGLSSFSSTVANSIWDFDSLFDFYASNIRMNKNDVPGVAQLLAGKYHLTQNPNAGIPIREYTTDGTVYYVIEKPACPIGYAVHDYILRDDFMNIEKEQRGIALLASAVIDKKDEDKVSEFAIKNTVDTIDFKKSADTYAAINSIGAVAEFSRNNSGFSCRAACVQDTLVYFSVPYSEGWKAYIDGAETSIINSGGMMLLPVPQGKHGIVFSYSIPGYKISKIISLISILGYLFYLIVSVRGKIY